MSERANELSDLVGTRTLSHVPVLTLRHPVDPDANGCAFRLDGVVYMVFEDPGDGYRSHAGPLLSFDGDFYQIGGSLWPEHLEMKVLCSMEGDGGDVLTMRDVATGNIVFRVGTDNSDDYYPYYVAEWTPPGQREAAR